MESDPDAVREKLAAIIEDNDETPEFTSIDETIPISILANPPEDAGVGVIGNGGDDEDLSPENLLLVRKRVAVKQKEIKEAKEEERALRKREREEEAEVVGIPRVKKAKKMEETIAELKDGHLERLDEHNSAVARMAAATERMANVYEQLLTLY